MKKLIILLTLSIISSSCHHEWVLRPEIKGYILNRQNKILKAKITTLPVDGEEHELALNKANGSFYFPKKTIKEWTFLGMEKPKGPSTTNKIIIKTEGYKTDTLDYTQYNPRENIIDLGNIFLEEEK